MENSVDYVTVRSNSPDREFGTKSSPIIQILCINNKKLTMSQHKKNTKKIIEFYLGENIHLSRSYFNKEGKSEFHVKTRENLARFLKEHTQDIKHNNL